MPTMMPVLVTMGPSSWALLSRLASARNSRRALVAAAGFGDAVEAGDGLDVVVEDLGARGDDHAAGFGDALEVGGEDFDSGAGRLAANFV